MAYPILLPTLDIIGLLHFFSQNYRRNNRCTHFKHTVKSVLTNSRPQANTSTAKTRSISIGQNNSFMHRRTEVGFFLYLAKLTQGTSKHNNAGNNDTESAITIITHTHRHTHVARLQAQMVLQVDSFEHLGKK